MSERHSLTLGVSALVRLRAAQMGGRIPAGTIGMVIEQRPETRYRYCVMIPGDPIPTWCRVDELDVLQGAELDAWWRPQ